ncbi:CASP2 and RIPK1 domain containing adaptor with death, gene 2 S homeolog isoform X1 [Xenopus laevis]|uniref:CASP2 and RIPK1 domain containing adaptor with death, gene 2 S homeolog n=2 Tax=Xenopus laevis TaxID=8355 RepID=Q6GR68_XENLA|nr:CASP2 and RIPK1 domain containing adaptor with death, gene 2 S homeolog [Xenopus laevis]XP_018087468.1 CASP2 and RIPK1 domain containing adaptor with death, gene 2 S homeolog isoform X1 [Xenopus laevis]XP_018087469.1 CASP2 and RIPK1 domain containing adaptor with death, gene 2 S homeolog isoform X1 [Xenopus laevis]XP_018087470.1 CASP2 and RIPK1 domain containing adaptor with death, gene 2 S homeolog isoform X1 [Xenopus laevis]XP_018087472.1 CASP2 and RIPK1 domain containing adaptor with deat
MDPKHKELLRRQRLELCAEGLADGLVPQYLLQEGIITESHLEEISSQVTSQRRAMKLLDILPTRGPKAFEVFVDSLSEFPWVRENLIKLSKDGTDIPGGRMLELPCKFHHSCPTEKQLNILAGKLGPEWEQILVHLGLDHSDLYRCKEQNRYSVQSQIVEGLVKWKRQMGSKATMLQLWQALEAAEADLSVMQYILQ